MPIQFSDTVRNARLDAIETAVNTSPLLRLYTGAPPATVATAASGTLLATLNLPSDWLANASGGTKALAGSWTGSATAGGTAGYYRILNTAGTTAHEQGTVGSQVQISTSASTAANGNVLTFTSTTGVTVGMNAAGTGVPPGASVVATTGTTVTLSLTSTAGVGSGVQITFTPDLTLDNPVLASGQSITITSKTYTEPNG